MGLRDRNIDDPAAVRKAELARVAITNDGIFCVWRVPRPTGGAIEEQIEVSPAVRNNLFGRVAFQTMLDNLAADTQDRIST